MNQYEQTIAVFAIDGYYLPRPHETAEAAFERARVEAIANLQRRIDLMKELDFSTFHERQKRGI